MTLAEYIATVDYNVTLPPPLGSTRYFTAFEEERHFWGPCIATFVSLKKYYVFRCIL